ncbi:MAG: glycosyltransferase [Candidatus Saganbacteria bacterium]|nr:glycosyltransferase [Candidatus Saganbacteria bacterium]
MKIALVHDYLNQFGGAERVVSALNEIWPDAPIYTSIYDEKKMPEEFKRMDIRVSFMQKLPLVFALFKYYFLFYPLAFERFDLSQYDVILSSSSAFAKGVRKRQGQLHICYCHNPMRFVWRYEDYTKQMSIPFIFKFILPFLLDPLKKWDLETASAVDGYIANSKTVAGRIKKIYGRESVIINPPVETDFFKPSNIDGDYFLVVSRLNAYKRIDLVVAAFNRLELPLKIVGSGPLFNKLKKEASSNIEFLGSVSDFNLRKIIAESRALIFAGEEDFGIVALEAMACGRPVIAYRAGGAEETVIDGQNGIFFDQQSVDSLIGAIKRFQFESFDKGKIREDAERFNKTIFKQQIKAFVDEQINKN